MLVGELRVIRDIPTSVVVPRGAQGQDPWHDGGRRGAARSGHGLRARGLGTDGSWGQTGPGDRRYLFPVHQEEKSPDELRDEDKAHQDEELEGSGTQESETSPTPRAAPRAAPLQPALPVPTVPGTRGTQGTSAQLAAQRPPWLQGGGLKTSPSCQGQGVPEKSGCRCSERGCSPHPLGEKLSNATRDTAAASQRRDPARWLYASSRL